MKPRGLDCLCFAGILLLALPLLGQTPGTADELSPGEEGEALLACAAISNAIEARHSLLEQRRLNPPQLTGGEWTSTAPAFSGDRTESASPDLRLTGIRVDDAAGNADGWIQPGETVNLYVSLVNLGSAPAQGVYGVLSPAEDDPYVTVNFNTAYWNDITVLHSGESMSSTFTVTVSNTLPCGYPVELTLTVSAIGFQASFPVRLDLMRTYSHDLVADTARRYNSADSVAYGMLANDLTGGAVAVGDFDGDGYKDLVIGQAGRASQAGGVYVLYGSSAGFTASVDLLSPGVNRYTWITGVDANDQLGQTLVMADLNGDGNDDIIASADNSSGLGNGRSQSGEVWVIYGRNTSSNTTIALAAPPANPTGTAVIYGTASGEFFGSSLGAGDLNGDRRADLIICAADATITGRPRTAAGATWILYGNGASLGSSTDMATHPSSTSVVYGPSSGAFIGYSGGNGNAAAAGDLNGDRYDDLIMGGALAPGATGAGSAGQVWTLYGTSTMLPSITDLATFPWNSRVLYGAIGGDYLGNAVTAGDFNGDGYEDLIAGALGAAGPGWRIASGEAWIFYGGASGIASADLRAPPSNATVIYGADAWDLLGFALTAADVNGDGYDDVVLGAYGAGSLNNGRTQAGEVWVVKGQAAHLPLALDLYMPSPMTHIIGGADEQDLLGYSLAAGDINKDGFADIFMGALNSSSLNNGRASAGEVSSVMGAADRTYWIKGESSSWIDATAGTNLGLHCDDCSTSIPIGFTFSFYGEKFTTIYISSNGLASFQPIDDALSSSPKYINSKFPSSRSGPGLFVAPFWANLDLAAQGNVYYQLSGTAPNRRLVVEWQNAPKHGVASAGATFEMALYESTGQILFQYQGVILGGSAYDCGKAAAVGVQNRTGSEGVAYQCFDGTISAGNAFSFNPTTPLFQDNMESLDTANSKWGKWRISGGALWHNTTGSLCTPAFHGRLQSLYEGINATCAYNDNINADYLLFPRLTDFPADARLSWWHRFQSEPNFDLGYVQKAIGGSPTTLAIFNASPGTGFFYPTPLLVSGSMGSAVDLSFWFHSDGSVSNYPGWMVDDVKLTGCNATGITSLVNPLAFATPAIYCGDGSNLGKLDAVGSQCGDGSEPITYQWEEDGASIPGANAASYTIPAGHAPGVFHFACAVICAGGSALSQPQTVTIVAPPVDLGDTLRVTKDDSGATERFTWTDAGGATQYDVFQDTAPGGAFAGVAGTASSGNPGLAISIPPESLIFYKAAGANATCGLGPK